MSPLAITLHFAGDYLAPPHEVVASTCEVLTQNSSRWNTLSLCFYEGAIELSMLEPIRGNLAILQNLEIHIQEETGRKEPFQSPFFNDCPSLNTVDLNLTGPSSERIRLPWQHITSLTLNTWNPNLGEIFRALSVCTNLRRLAWSLDGTAVLASNNVHLSHLQSLSITVDEPEILSVLLPHLSVPKLSSIELCNSSDTWRDRTWDEEPFKRFLIQSSCTITSLHLRYLPITDIRVLLFLELLPNLHSFCLQECTYKYPPPPTPIYLRIRMKDNVVVTRTFLTRLTIDCESLAKPIVPRLTDLELVLNVGLEQQALIEMLSSRWLPEPPSGIDALKSFSLTVMGQREDQDDESEPEPECFALLQHFRRAGLRVTTSYNRELW
uniref:F-box domain-containing protein n=1 Tax=Moniliophthora roreri TaxID=221103 RepID=A0A0W0F4D0_MONRR